MPTTRAVTHTVLNALGISPDSYEEFVAWALCEHLVAVLAHSPDMNESFFARPDALRAFRDGLNARTGRKWSQSDYERLFDRVKQETRKHDRRPVTYEEYVKLLWQVPLKCAHCGREPPAVVLHVDHIVPASLGGSSLRYNLQFLCAEHNLRKSNNRERGKPWLSLQ